MIDYFDDPSKKYLIHCDTSKIYRWKRNGLVSKKQTGKRRPRVSKPSRNVRKRQSMIPDQNVLNITKISG